MQTNLVGVDFSGDSGAPLVVVVSVAESKESVAESAAVNSELAAAEPLVE